MGFFRKKHDPISEKAKALNAQIAALESEIQRLNETAAKPQPRFRSTTNSRPVPPEPPARREPPPQDVFESVDQSPLKAPEPQLRREHYNDLGVRKYDLPALWERLKNSLKGPPTSNPKLVNYLAAGSIQGLRPLRYEKRVARNRFILLVVVLVLMLWGILAVLFKR